MKSRFSALFFAILLFVPFGLFLFPQTVSAQAMTQDQQDLYGRGVQIFETEKQLLLANKITPSDPNQPSPTDALVKAVNFAETLFQGVYKNEITGIFASTPDKAHNAALEAAITFLNNPKNFTNARGFADEKYRLTDEELKTVVNVFGNTRLADFTKLLGVSQITDFKPRDPNSNPVLDNAKKDAAKEVTDIKQDVDGSACSISFVPGSEDFNLADCAVFLSSWLIKTLLLGFANIFVAFFAYLFHYAVYFGVLNFASAFGVGGTLLYPLWQTVRDIVNLVVIFFSLGLIIMYLINQGNTMKRLVPWLMIYALFVNFSWLATRTVVDYSNIITLKLYNVTAPGALDLNSQRTPAFIIMNNLGLQTDFMETTKVDGQRGLIDKINHPGTALLVVAQAFYTAYIFFVAAILFMLRTALLVFFIIASPFLMLDAVLPFVGEYAKKARTIFFSQLALGPVFMIFLFLTTQIMATIKESIDKVGSIGSEGTPLLSFGTILMLIFLTIMIKTTKKLSGGIGDSVSSFAGKGLMTVAGGGAGFALRGTLGAVGSRLAASKTLDKWQSTAIGRGIKSGADRLSTGTYDFRNLKPIASLNKFAGIEQGTPMKRGYNQVLADQKKAFEEKALSIKDEATRNEFVTNKSDGPLNINKARRAIGKATGLGSVETKSEKIANEYRLDQYKKATMAEKTDLKNKADTNLRKEMEAIDNKEAKERKRRAEEVVEREQMKAEARLAQQQTQQSTGQQPNSATPNTAPNQTTQAASNSQPTLTTLVDENGRPIDIGRILRDIFNQPNPPAASAGTVGTPPPNPTAPNNNAASPAAPSIPPQSAPSPTTAQTSNTPPTSPLRPATV